MKEPKKKVKKKKTVKQITEKNPVGRPPAYKTPEEIQIKIDEYFKNCPDKISLVSNDRIVELPVLTITGLAYYLGFADRHSFYAYEQKEEFSHTIKRARTLIEIEYEKQLRSGNVTGAIFALKNFGWKDTQHNINDNTNIDLTEELTDEEMREELDRFKKSI